LKALKISNDSDLILKRIDEVDKGIKNENGGILKTITIIYFREL
jgi:hypothetical protein